MTARVVWLAFAWWLLMGVLAVANGILREAVLLPWLGEVGGQGLSFLLLAAIVAALQWFLVTRPWRDLGTGPLFLIGAGWACATVLFEFALGRLVLNMTWQELLRQYDVFSGRLWPFIPLLMLLGMPMMRTVRSSARKGTRAGNGAQGRT